MEEHSGPVSKANLPTEFQPRDGKRLMVGDVGRLAASASYFAYRWIKDDREEEHSPSRCQSTNPMISIL